MSVPKQAEKMLEPQIEKWKKDFAKTHINRAKLSFALSDARDTTGASYLYVTALNNDIEMTGYLLSYLADPNVGFKNFTPLYVAAERGYVEIVESLISAKKIDIEKGRLYDFSPLHAAACNGHLDVVMGLAAHGAKLDKPAADKNTPIMTAATRGYTDIVEFLLNKGASIKQIRDEESLLMMAAK